MEKRIKIIREIYGLTQNTFAKKIGVAQNTIANYEAGKRKPSKPIIRIICNEFNVNEKWLLEGQGEPIQSVPIDNQLEYFLGRILSSNDSFKKNVLLSICTLTEDEWVFLEKLVNNLKEKQD